MKHGNKSLEIFGLFKRCHFVVEESPLLAEGDLEGPDGASLYLSWIDEEGGGSYTIPHESLEDAVFEDASVLLKDADGQDCRVTFYAISPVLNLGNVFTVSWQFAGRHETCEVTLPRDVTLPVGEIRMTDFGRKGGYAVLSEVLAALGIGGEFPPGQTQYGQTLFVTKGPVGKRDLTDFVFN